VAGSIVDARELADRLPSFVRTEQKAIPTKEGKCEEKIRTLKNAGVRHPRTQEKSRRRVRGPRHAEIFGIV
jgi:hypothetical protein